MAARIARPFRRAGRWLIPILGFALGFLLAGPDALLWAASGGTAVVDAARNDNLPAVLKLIQERADVNAPASDGSSALLWSAYHSNVEMAKALLAAGATVDAANRYGVTPLLQASRNGDVEMMRTLLEAGADPARWHAEGETALMAAARTGNVEAVRLLLAHGAFVNATDQFQEQTALMWASAEGHLEVVKTLLAAGADPNLKAHISPLKDRKHADHPSGGFTALMFAARNGHRDVVEALMKGGADPRLTNADGLTATMIAIINDRLDLAKEMFDLGADPNDGSLYFAVEMHDQTIDTRAQDSTRMQPDHPNQLTALSLIKALLDLGADVNKPFSGQMHSTSMCCPPRINSSPFYRAATASDTEVLKLLVAKGAQLEWTPPEAAPQNGKAKAKGPGPGPGGNPNAGRTPLMMAMKGGGGPPIQGGPGYQRNGPPVFREPGSREPVDAVKVLLAAGANPNAKAGDGSTPLHQAVQLQRVDLIRALAEAGASMDAVDKDNLTPLLLAESQAKKAREAKAPVDTGAPATNRPKRDSPEEVVAVLRELMHLGPDDPAPQPPPPAKPAPSKDGKGKAGKQAKAEPEDNPEDQQ
jgi:ankyrin repeat protein